MINEYGIRVAGEAEVSKSLEEDSKNTHAPQNLSAKMP
jgi:hypothetical protein